MHPFENGLVKGPEIPDITILLSLVVITGIGYPVFAKIERGIQR